MFSEDMLNRLYRYGYSLTANEADAYDLLQESLTRFLELDPPPDTSGEPVFYLQRIMHNRFIDQLRRAKRFPLEALDGADAASGDTGFVDLERIAISEQTLRHVWERLSPLERELMHLWAVEELTAREIAERLDTPRNTILSRIHRLRKKVAPLASDPVASADGGTSA